MAESGPRPDANTGPDAVAGAGVGATEAVCRACRWLRRLALWTLLLGVPLWALWLEPDALVVRQVELPLPGPPGRQLAGLKIALVADIHAGAPWIGPEKLARVVKEVNATKPDLILLAGDFIAEVHGGRTLAPSETGRLLAGLAAPLGTFAVLGNHDYTFNPGLVADGLEGNGIRVLEGSGLDLSWHGHPFRLAGVGDLNLTHADPLAGLMDLQAAEPVLFLTHNPDLFYRPSVPLPVTLMLAGHTHGGQVALPLIGALYYSADCKAKCLKGLAPRDGSRSLYVTTGIGTSQWPIRFGVPPEIVVLTLRAE